MSRRYVPLKEKGNTKVSENKGHTLVRLYRTYVVKFSDSVIILNTGGYRTVTTKDRMNQTSKEYFLDYSVYQVKGVWYVEYRGQVYPFVKNILTLRRCRTAITDSLKKEILDCYRKGELVSQIAKRLGVSVATIYRKINERGWINVKSATTGEYYKP